MESVTSRKFEGLNTFEQSVAEIPNVRSETAESRTVDHQKIQHLPDVSVYQR